MSVKAFIVLKLVKEGPGKSLQISAISIFKYHEKSCKIKKTIVKIPWLKNVDLEAVD